MRKVKLKKNTGLKFSVVRFVYGESMSHYMYCELFQILCLDALIKRLNYNDFIEIFSLVLLLQLLLNEWLSSACHALRWSLNDFMSWLLSPQCVLLCHITTFVFYMLIRLSLDRLVHELVFLPGNRAVQVHYYCYYYRAAGRAIAMSEVAMTTCTCPLFICCRLLCPSLNLQTTVCPPREPLTL